MLARHAVPLTPSDLCAFALPHRTRHHHCRDQKPALLTSSKTRLYIPNATCDASKPFRMCSYENCRVTSFKPRVLLRSKLDRNFGAEIPTWSGLPTLALSPLPATLMALPASVADKRLTAGLSPLDATLTKNTGGGGQGALLTVGWSLSGCFGFCD